MNGTSPGITSIEKHPGSYELGRWINRFSRHWILVFGLIMGLYVGLPFLAPILIKSGWEPLARSIYLIYSFQCHQLPQRSYFLFGSKMTYSLTEIQALSPTLLDPLILRKFIGNPEMGWKVAWSDRMVAMFASIWIFGILWKPLRGWLKPLPWWGLVFFLLPLIVDGTSHFISDLYGIGQGFRDSNAWLADLTKHAFSPAFYTGDVWGSFNSIMRLLTGILFGLGIVWFGFPYIDDAISPRIEYVKP